MNACPNCGAPFAEPKPRYCPHCGQETHLRPPRLGEFLQQFGGAYLATEGALWRTLRLLLLEPGELTRRYLAGRRKHYVLPLRLYLTISVIVLLALRLLADGVEGGAFKFDVGAGGNKQVTLLAFGDRTAGFDKGRFFCTDLPAWVCTRLKRRVDVDAAGMQRQAAELGERFMANIGAAMFVLLPLFALWLKLAWIDRGLRYTEHLVFALHLHAFWFVALALTLPGYDALALGAVVAAPVYAWLACRRVYGGRWWSLLLRGALVSLLYLLTLGVVMLALALATLLS